MTYIENARGLSVVSITMKRIGATIEAILLDDFLKEVVEVISLFHERHHGKNIRRGENGGRPLTYHNVVKGLKSTAMWRGKEKRIAILENRETGDVCVVIL